MAATASGVEAAANALAVEPHAPAAAVAPGQTLQPTVSHQELSGDDFQAADGDTLDEPEVQRPQQKQLEVRAAPLQPSQRPQTQPLLGLGLSQAAPSASLAMPSSQYTDVHSKGGSFLDRGMVTLFKSKVADHPLATLNPK